jgi:hypothetical protein
MLSRKLQNRFLAALTGVTLLAATAADAAILPAPAPSSSDIQLAWCAVGAHIGPVGACIGSYHRWHHCWINRWGRRVCN